MAKLYVSYRGEFGAVVEVEDVGGATEKASKAIEKFRSGDCKIGIVGNLWHEYFEVADVKTEEILKEEGGY